MDAGWFDVRSADPLSESLITQRLPEIFKGTFVIIVNPLCVQRVIDIVTLSPASAPFLSTFSTERVRDVIERHFWHRR